MKRARAMEYYEPPKTKTIRSIIEEVGAKYGFTYIEMLGPRRGGGLGQARQEAYWRCRKETTRTCATIGECFGMRDHTTITKGAEAHEKRLRLVQAAGE